MSAVRLSSRPSRAGNVTGPLAETIVASDVVHASTGESMASQRRQLYHTMRRNVLGQIAAGTIHESLQPLYAIGNLTGACRNTLRADGEIDKQKLLGWLDGIARGVDSAKALLLRLRSFDDISAPNKSSVCLDEVVEPIARMLASELEPAEVVFECDLGCDCLVEVDASQLRQVLVELVFNAADACIESGRKPSRVTLKTECQDGDCHISVHDNGPGVATEVVGQIFKPFYSSDCTKLGLGLSFCKSMITAHGGTLLAKSNESGGLSVHFTIPGSSGAIEQDNR
jgi:signal transduction histidine kinase